MKKKDLENILSQIGALVAKANLGMDDAGDEIRSSSADIFAPQDEDAAFGAAAPETHCYGNKSICESDSRGFATPENRSPAELVLDASEGFIPLWARGVTLRWRFNEPSMSYFHNPGNAMNGIRELLSDAILAWGDAGPVGFNELRDSWDFEIVMRNADRCNVHGCTLASAFFPDGGRHQLVLYPQMFRESRKEQVDTLIHEIGHIFGLRHFFAAVSEAAWPSVIFGTHRPFSIMNYGHQSELTEDDKSDLQHLYDSVWRGELTEINGTPIRLMEPYHASGSLVWPSLLGKK